MKLFFKYSVIIFPLLAVSCMADLDVKPTESIDQSVAFKSVDDANAGVLGVYAAISTTSLSVTSLISDEATWPLENNTNRGTSTFSWKQDPLTAEVIAAWANFYQVLDRANRVLAAIDNVPAAPLEEATKQQLKGELLALRAFSHFELLRHYAVSYHPDSAGIPIMLVSAIGKPKRDSVRKVYAQINADLATAKTLIPATFTNKNRITRIAVSAMQARAALWQQQWDDAITFSTEVINAMALATRAEFPDIWLDRTNAEVIWKLKREAQDAKFGDFYRDGSNKILFAPSFKLMGTFDAANDVRFNAYVKDLGAGRWTVNKYVGGQTALANLADIKLFRVAEMYLVRAEAYAMKGATGLTPGTTDLNNLRKQRIAGYTDQTFASPADLLDGVILERFKELAFEGHRYFDLRRTNRNIQRIAQDVTQAPAALTLTPNDKAYYIPIPSREILANENISQHWRYR